MRVLLVGGVCLYQPPVLNADTNRENNPIYIALGHAQHSFTFHTSIQLFHQNTKYNGVDTLYFNLDFLERKSTGSFIAGVKTKEALDNIQG